MNNKEEKHYFTPNVFMSNLGPVSNIPFEELNAYERYICQGGYCCISVVPVLGKGKDIIYNDMFKHTFIFTNNGDLKEGIFTEITVKEFHEKNMLDLLIKEGWNKI
jgi:hypothetical protein